MPTDFEIGEFDEDGALDERDTLIAWLTQRIDESTRFEGFCGVDISGVRANIAMLSTIIRQHGGGNQVERTKVEEWAARIEQPFTDASLWGFTPWPEELKNEWRVGCRQTVQKLLSVLDD